MYDYVVQASSREDADEEEEILRNPPKSGRYATMETSLMRPGMGQDSQATNGFKATNTCIMFNKQN